MIYKMKKITALLYTLVFCLSSCMEEIEYEDMGLDNFIVLNGTFIDGESPWCQVMKSDIIFGNLKKETNIITYLRDASVTATNNGNSYNYSTIGDSAKMQADGLTVAAGGTYKIVAKSNGLDDVSATVTVPSKPTTEFRYVGLENMQDSVIAFYELTITDNGETEDYYQLALYGSHYEFEYQFHDTIIDNEFSIVVTGADTTVKKGDLKYDFFSEDPIMNWNETIYNNAKENPDNLIDDKLFNGKTVTIKLGIFLFADQKFEDLVIDIRHITKETYLYHSSLNRIQRRNGSTSLAPDMLYCNVENGAGLVAAWSSVKVPFEVPEFDFFENLLNRVKKY